MQYSWPGNVRELENAIEHAIVLGLTDEILPEDLPEGAAGKAIARRDGGAVSQHAEPDQEAAGDHRGGRRERKPHRGRKAVRNPSQVPASVDQESEFEVRSEAVMIWPFGHTCSDRFKPPNTLFFFFLVVCSWS